jgi:hypothetical protein
MTNKLLANRLKYSWNYLLNPISQAKKTTLNVFVIILKNFVQLVEKLDISLNNNHPAKVFFEKKQESQNAFPSNDNMLVF